LWVKKKEKKVRENSRGWGAGQPAAVHLKLEQKGDRKYVHGRGKRWQKESESQEGEKKHTKERRKSCNGEKRFWCFLGGINRKFV